MQARKQINYTKETVLPIIEKIGKTIKAKTELGYWSAEDSYKMKFELKNLEVIRNCYRQIKAGSNINMQLKAAAHKISGIEGNKLNLLADGLSLTEWEEK